MAEQLLWQAGAAQFLQLTALITIIYLVARRWARNRPHLAYALWLVVLLKCVTPPLWASPTGVFCWLRATTETAPVDEVHIHLAQEPTSPIATIARDSDGESAAIAGLDTRSVDAQIPLSARAAPTVPAPALSADASSSPRWTLSRAIPVLWLAGALVAILVSGVRFVRCLRQLRASPTRDNPELVEVVARLAQRLKLRRQVRGCCISESRIGPAVLGLVRPTIVLPACVVEGRSTADLEPILAHELIHVRRGDLWSGLLQVLAQSAWWFHPLVRVAGRAAAREAERCCDEEVLGSLGYAPARYARGLIDVLELKSVLVPLPAFPGVRPMEVTSQRLERIMSLGQGCRRRASFSCWLVMLMVGLATLPGAALVIGGEEPAASHAAEPPAQSLSEFLNAPAGSGYSTAESPSAEKQEIPIPESWSEKEFDAGDLLKLFKKQTSVQDDAQAKQCVLSQLELILSLDRQTRELFGSGSPPLIDDGAGGQKFAWPENQVRGPVVRWSGDTIVARYSPARPRTSCEGAFAVTAIRFFAADRSECLVPIGPSRRDGQGFRKDGAGI